MLNLEAKLISIKTERGKNEYLKHSHSKVCWSVEKLHSEPQGVGRTRSRDGGSESVSDSCYPGAILLITDAHVTPTLSEPEDLDC